MGNSTSLDQCVSLENSRIYTDSSYTIKRTSGAMEDGWVISKPKVIGTSFPPWINQHATKQTPNREWKIFMHNGSGDPNLFLCGWRSLETIYPSSLTGGTESIRAWRYEFLKHLETLDELRQMEQREIEDKQLLDEGFYNSVAFVRNNQYDLFGYYSVVKTDLGYEFTLKKPARTHPNLLNQIGQISLIPLWQEFGKGDWEHVTPDKILDLSTRNPLNVTV